MKKHLLSLLSGMAILIAPPSVSACSCSWDLPKSFCESMWFWPAPHRPNVVLMAVKLNDVAHGMDVKVVDVLYGHANDTIRVWGDPGHLCRPYTAGFPIGDTLVLALDSLEYFYDVEDTGHYAINICGVYYLAVENGKVLGPVYGAQQQQVDYALFKDSVMNGECNPSKVTGIGERELDRLEIRFDRAGYQLLFAGVNLPIEVNVYDASGKILIRGKAVAGESTLSLPPLSAGVYLVEVKSKNGRKVQRMAMM